MIVPLSLERSPAAARLSAPLINRRRGFDLLDGHFPSFDPCAHRIEAGAVEFGGRSAIAHGEIHKPCTDCIEPAQSITSRKARRISAALVD